ncbi:hypothetical protein P691DRAFT_802309 [Macrolepiota fuliginosa MF-IS2]|uniref:Uncharacterized protein n=1 Tax=Macrolepiota fuliginosa MF-IS2 TaxID=1400762 RepID=A0A9P5XCR8_9AGAR|nr:hypothetical protein P691DRAFT_802309 [Macrolepiota fuliginosa MF-IS2]
MAKLEAGLYIIRFVPVGIQPPFVGGLYAQAKDYGQPIAAEPLGPNSPAEVWEVNVQNGKYIITQRGFTSKNPLLRPGPVLAGWSLANPPDKYPGGYVLFTVDYQEFDIEPVGEGEHLMYSVKVPSPGGAGAQDIEYVVTEQEDLLFSKAYASGPRFRRPIPHWQFIPAGNK